MNLHLKPRSIYISRHGESEFNLKGLIGGDSALSSNGRMYGERLREFIKKYVLAPRFSFDSYYFDGTFTSVCGCNHRVSCHCAS